MADFSAYAAVYVEDGVTSLIGTCAVPGGAAAFAVACGKPDARVVGLDAETAERVAALVLDGMVEIPSDHDLRERAAPAQE